MFQDYSKQNFEDLLKPIGQIKKILSKTRPLIILTASISEFPSFKPDGGKILSRLGGVLVLINDNDRYTEYLLVQHPDLPENRLLK